MMRDHMRGMKTSSARPWRASVTPAKFCAAVCAPREGGEGIVWGSRVGVMVAFRHISVLVVGIV
jgi:hypothetical protein